MSHDIRHLLEMILGVSKSFIVALWVSTSSTGRFVETKDFE